MIDAISAGDVNANPITAIADNFGQFSSDMLTTNDNETLPGKFALHPNYPNPFNPSTVITYDIAKSSDVRAGVSSVYISLTSSSFCWAILNIS